MDYLKPVASVLTLFIALCGILLNTKEKIRPDDPAQPEREVLNRLGWIVLVLVVCSGLFTVVSDLGDSKKPVDDKKLLQELTQLRQSASVIQKKQEQLNRMTAKLLHVIEHQDMNRGTAQQRSALGKTSSTVRQPLPKR
jgi:hypothetical protein